MQSKFLEFRGDEQSSSITGCLAGVSGAARGAYSMEGKTMGDN